jgi:hypothetical protein
MHNRRKVLFVLSAEDTLLLNKGKKERQTGVFLNEFYLAYKAIKTEGYMPSISPLLVVLKPPLISKALMRNIGRKNLK